MVKIIHEGNTKKKKVYKCTCGCGCIWETDEIKNVHESQYDVSVAKCPCCKDEVTDIKLLR